MTDFLINVANYFISSPWELIGAASGLLCVWLIIRENIWNWPVGLAYALVSLLVFYKARLYSDLVLHVFYVFMNGYGWYYWLRGAGARSSGGRLVVARLRKRSASLLGVATVIGIVAMGWLFDYYTDADLAYWDSTTTVMSFAAMWMAAHKYIENWIVWLVIDVLATGIYIFKGIWPYAVLYGLYIPMAVWGWMAWLRSMSSSMVKDPAPS
ncbi:MAG: nicotinamide riboside transporter PnuC [Pseudomonadales bacterium]|nr:nicotinamide riboside transporter PnuC [Pseudomonadales bacterium]